MKESRDDGGLDTLTRTKEFKSSYDSALCLVSPLSISVSFLSLPKRENFAFIFRRRKERRLENWCLVVRNSTLEIAFCMQA